MKLGWERNPVEETIGNEDRKWIKVEKNGSHGVT
jgi:hypothetical protein